MAERSDAALHPFVRSVASALRHRCGVKPGARLLVATSGGADSVALLRALALLAARRTWHLKLSVGHVQHHMRDADQAEADAAFVNDLAGSMELPYVRADLEPERLKPNAEAGARRERYKALAEMARAAGAGAVVTAHHADDQLETLLMRLLRGASVRGLAGIAWRRVLREGGEPWVVALRPMLAVRREAAQGFLKDIAQPWREDHTNADVTRLRARLRHEVLPLLTAIRPDAAQRSVSIGEHMRQVALVLDEAVSRAADRVVLIDGRASVDRIEARALPPVVLHGLLRRLLTERGVAADRLGGKTMNPIVRAIRDTRGGVRSFSVASVGVVVERGTVMVG